MRVGVRVRMPSVSTKTFVEKCRWPVSPVNRQRLFYAGDEANSLDEFSVRLREKKTGQDLDSPERRRVAILP
jgi:hypothetical protein